jgi:hypothetical protein
MNKCKNCNHYYFPSINNDGNTIGECDNYSTRDTQDKDNFGVAGVYDGPIYVGEDFGCVRWVRNETT